MKIVVDANIVFSAIINTNGKIGDLLINGGKKFEFIAPEFLRHEIKRHHSKMMKISGMSLGEILESEFQIYKSIQFISEEQIKTSYWLIAENLVADIDPNDVQYIAYSKHFKCKIWSGDKALMKGLKKKNFTKFLTTDELYQIHNTKRQKK
jgi:predicted nucleic acid-binding protein